MGRRGNSEGSITKRSDGRWMARVTLPDGNRRHFYGKTRQEVAKKLMEAQRSISDGLPIPPEKQTLGQFLNSWLENSAKPTLRPYTYQSYSSMVRLHIAPALGNTTLARLNAQHIQSFLNRKREGGLSARTVQYLHAILRRALGQAERWGLVPRNVARLVSPPRVSRPEVQPLEPAEVKKLLAAVKEDRLSALYTVALALGLRQGEALGLRWQDVNLEAGTLTVRGGLQLVDGYPVLVEPKTDRSRRTIKLPSICVAVLRKHRSMQEGERALVGAAWNNGWDLVFTAEDGSPLSRYAVTHRFQRILARAGLPKHRFHDLRHTCATLLLVQGVPLRVVMEVLGHSQMATTADIYSHVLPVLMADAAQRMDEALVGP